LPPVPGPTDGRSSARILAAALFVALAACETPRAGEEPEDLHLQAFRDLIEKGVLRPSEEFDEEDYFAELALEYADEPRAADEVGGFGGGIGPVDPFDEEEIPYNPYLEFGEDIMPYADGRLMKPYPFPPGTAAKMHQLLQRYFPFELFVGEAGMEQPLDTVALDLQEGWITESWSDPRNADLESWGNPVVLGDMIFVTATPELMREVEQFINKFGANVRQIEIEAKIVEVITTDTLDIGIRAIDDSTPMFGFPDGTLVRAFDFSFPTGADPSALLAFSSVHDGLAFNAVLEAVATSENVTIISRPKVAVREGARAEIVNVREIPFFNISGVNQSGNFTAGLEYKEVGVQMYVIPRIIGTDTVILNIDIESSQETGTSVTFTSGGIAPTEISNPIIARRRARTIVRLEPGQAVVLGGLISERKVKRETKVPFLGDIPIIGNLFKSQSTKTERTNVLFFIRPRILQGSDLNRPFE